MSSPAQKNVHPCILVKSFRVPGSRTYEKWTGGYWCNHGMWPINLMWLTKTMEIILIIKISILGIFWEYSPPLLVPNARYLLCRKWFCAALHCACIISKQLLLRLINCMWFLIVFSFMSTGSFWMVKLGYTSQHQQIHVHIYGVINFLANYWIKRSIGLYSLIFLFVKCYNFFKENMTKTD